MFSPQKGDSFTVFPTSRKRTSSLISEKSATVLECFLSGVSKFGLPHRVTSDKGVENTAVADFIISARGHGKVSMIRHPEVSIALHGIPFVSVVALPCFHHKKEIPSRFFQLQGKGHHHLYKCMYTIWSRTATKVKPWMWLTTFRYTKIHFKQSYK
jgi:hypothetical protein